MSLRNLILSTTVGLAACVAASSASAAVCIGNCGTAAPNGVVTAPPADGPNYRFVSTDGGASGAGQIAGVGGVDGSEFISDAFAAQVGDDLSFYFNYVTSDGTGSFVDYAFAELISGTDDHVAWLFTARTTPSGDTSPGFGLPSNDSILTPLTSPIIAGGPVWSALGGSSGSCYQGPANGCGYTGWIQSSYSILAAGSYKLRFGVSNYGDSAFDSGLAYAGAVIGGVPIIPGTPGVIPEPATWAMMILGFGAIGASLRRRRATQSAYA